MTLNNYIDCSYLPVHCLHLLLLLLFLILSLWAGNINTCFALLAIKHSALTDFGANRSRTLPLTKIRLSDHENCAAQKCSNVNRFS